MASDGVYEGVVSGSDAAAAPPPALPFSPAYAFPSQPPPPNPTYSAVVNTEDMSVEEVDCGDTATDAAPQQPPQLLLPCSATMNEEEEENENEEAEGAPRRLQVDPAVLRELHDSRTRNTSSTALPHNYCYYNNAYGVDPATAALARHCHRGLFAENNSNNSSAVNYKNDGAWPSPAGSLRPPSPRTLQRLLAQAAATGQPIDWAKAASLAANGVLMNGAPALSASIPLALTWYPDIPAGATAHPERKRPVRSENNSNSSNEEAGGGGAVVVDGLLSSSSQAELGNEADVQGGSGGGGSTPVWSFPRVKRARQEEPQKELLSEEHYYYKGHYYSRERDKASAAALVPTPCEGTEVRAADHSVPVAVQKRRAGVAKRARDGMTMCAAEDDDDEADVAQRHRRTEEAM